MDFPDSALIAVTGAVVAGMAGLWKGLTVLYARLSANEREMKVRCNHLESGQQKCIEERTELIIKVARLDARITSCTTPDCPVRAIPAARVTFPPNTHQHKPESET